MLAQDRRVIPVVRRLMADAETPVGVYRKLARDRPGTFLLESAEHGGVWSRYSIVGAACRATLTERDGEACWIGEPPVGVPTERQPRSRRCATPWPRWPPSRSRAAAADRRHGRRHRLRRGAPLGAGARRRRRTTSASPRSR